jgi:outer membrane protein assembly factor BamB
LIAFYSPLSNQGLADSAVVVWPAFDGGGGRSGVNAGETSITASSVSNMRRIWQAGLPAKADSSPVEVRNVTTSQGNKDLVLVNTVKGTLVAIDAATGAIVWQAPTSGPFVQNQGTKSSPAIDPSAQFVYAYGLDGKVHKYAVGTGIEATGTGFPATTSLIPDVEKGSSSLNVGNGYLYMTMSGYDGDFGHYVGHAVAVNLASGVTTVFNSQCANLAELLTSDSTQQNYCKDYQSGIWGRGGAVIDPTTNDVFVATGNGLFNASTGGHDYGDSVVKLSPDLTTILDTYTPSTYPQLDQNDWDLGSAAPALLPVQSGTSTPDLAVQGGKDNRLRLLNRQKLSGQNGPNHVGGELQVVTGIGCDIDSHPAVWTDGSGQTWVFVTDICNSLYAYKLVNNGVTSTLQLAYQNSNGGSSPFLADSVLFVQGNSVVYAMNPTNGQVLWNSTQASGGGTVGPLHWESPLVANGMLYAVDENGQISAYGLVPLFLPFKTYLPLVYP